MDFHRNTLNHIWQYLYDQQLHQLLKKQVNFIRNLLAFN